MSQSIPSARLRQLYPLADALIGAAHLTADAVNKTWKKHRRVCRGAVIKPGPATPLWNELVRAVECTMIRRGDKTRLARMLGVSRQRVHLLIVAKTACTDAERTLQLLAWLSSRLNHQRSKRCIPSAPF